ncbi:MAG: hypothetical protein SGJ11_06765 [Phycisphaerae bacterium]|nr:hypothetical protein [Phycisphaerae bacterium]
MQHSFSGVARSWAFHRLTYEANDGRLSETELTALTRAALDPRVQAALSESQHPIWSRNSPFLSVLGVHLARGTLDEATAIALLDKVGGPPAPFVLHIVEANRPFAVPLRSGPLDVTFSSGTPSEQTKPKATGNVVDRILSIRIDGQEQALSLRDGNRPMRSDGVSMEPESTLPALSEGTHGVVVRVERTYTWKAGRWMQP